MKTYRMKVKTYNLDDHILCTKWFGSELFEAESVEAALKDAIGVECRDHKECGHELVSTSLELGDHIWTSRPPGLGWVSWMADGKCYAEEIIMEECEGGENDD